MRHIIGATLILTFLLVATLLGFVGLQMRSHPIAAESIPPKSAQIVIRIPALASHWDSIQNSNVVQALLSSTVFETMDEADELQKQVDDKLQILLPNDPTYPGGTRHDNPVLKFREALNSLQLECRRLKFNITEKHHTLDLVGRDVLVCLRLQPSSRDIDWMASTVVGGRGFAIGKAIPYIGNPVHTEKKMTIYELKESPGLFLCATGDRLFATNSKELLTESLQQIADTDYDGSLRLPPLHWKAINARVDIAALRRLKPYSGNFFSSMTSLFQHYSNHWNTDMAQGGPNDWLFDLLVFNDCLHVNYLDEMMMDLSIHDDLVEIDMTITTGSLQSNSITGMLQALPAEAETMATLLPEETIAFNRSQLQFEDWIKILKQETLDSIASKGGNASERNQLRQEAELDWQANWAQINAAISPKTLEGDVIPNLGPNYGFAAIWTGMPEGMEPQDMLLPGMVYFLQFDNNLRDDAAKLTERAIDSFLKKVDQNRDQTNPGYSPAYNGIQAVDWAGTTIYKVDLDLEQTDLTLAAGLGKNLSPGYMILQDYLIVASNMNSLQAIADAAAGQKPTLQSKHAEAFQGDANLSLFVNARAGSEFYRALADSLSVMDSAMIGENSRYPQERILRKEIHLKKGAILDLFKTFRMQSSWEDDGHHIKLQIKLPESID